MRHDSILGLLRCFFAFGIAFYCCGVETTLAADTAHVNPKFPPIILISIDTLRADRLSCYGDRGPGTPRIDAVSKGGTLFSQVSSPTPLTMPSHASLLTATHPFFHGVEDNSQQLSRNITTLASVLKSSGYRTAAFVGSYVLDRRFGLDHGFDIYDSPFDLHRRSNRGDSRDARRLGEDVVRAATDWIEQNSGEPFFVFLHLYDLHKPYDLPSTIRKRFKGTGYNMQLSYVDEVLGSFWNYITKANLLQKALIIFTSDHGEGLGDHGESTHGYYIYQSTLNVPLIFHWPAGSSKVAARIDQPVSLLDVAPTILQFVTLPRPPEFQGRSLLGLVNEKEETSPREIYSESLFARDHFGCSALRSLRLGRYKYIDAPKPEFYDLAMDPAETQNLYAKERSSALSLRERMLAVLSRFQPARTVETRAPSAEALATLRSLGYVAPSRSHSNLSNSGADPKDRIAEAETYHYAVALASSGRLLEANALLEKLRVKLPEVTAVYNSLGMNEQKLGKHIEAAESFRQVLKRDPQDVEAHYNLAVSSFAMKQVDNAVKELQTALTLDPDYSRAYYLLGTLWMQRKDHSRARENFSHMLAIAPSDYAAHYHLGLLATIEGKWQEGERHLVEALKTDPGSAEAHNALGSLFLQRGDLDRANHAFLEAIRLDPKLPWGYYNLGLLYRRRENDDEARKQFRQALSADPNFREASEALKQLGRE